MSRMQRNLTRTARLTVQTTSTTHPSGTIPDHWFWEIMTSDGVQQQHQTTAPVLDVSLPPDSYGVTVQLEDANNVAIGEKVMTSFVIEGPDVEIQTAGAVTVDIV